MGKTRFSPKRAPLIRGVVARKRGLPEKKHKPPEDHAPSSPLCLRTKRDEETEVIKRCQRGDEDAFNEIVKRYQPRVTSIICRIIRSPNDREDIRQEVFIKIYSSIKGFNFRAPLSTWIHRVTVNECYDYLRKKRVRKLVYESNLAEGDPRIIENMPECADDSPGADVRTGNRDYLARLLSRVSEEERMLLIGKEVEGHTIRDLAKMTGINHNTIKVKLLRTRKKLTREAKKISFAMHPATYSL